MNIAIQTLDEHEQAIRQKFDKWAKDFDNRGSIFRYFQKKVLSFINFEEGSHFLDVGCGTGWAVRYVARLLHGRGQFDGIDISEKMVERARATSHGMENVSFFNGSAENLPLEDDFYDNIICTFSFHHYLHPQKVLVQMARVLKSKGRVYILDVTSDDFFINIIDKLSVILEKEHVRQYSTAELRQMFSRSGFRYLESKRILLYPVKVHVAMKV